MEHPFDTACALTRAGDGRFSGTAPDAYWNMAGPFGGTTAAVLLRAALFDQPEGVEPVALTVNYCAPLSKGAFTIDARTVRSGKSVRHVSLQMQQHDGIVATASVVLALRRDTWSHQVASMPEVPPPDAVAADAHRRPPGLAAALRVPLRARRVAAADPDLRHAAQRALHAVGGRLSRPARSTTCRWPRCATCSSCARSTCAARWCRPAP